MKPSAVLALVFAAAPAFAAGRFFYRPARSPSSRNSGARGAVVIGSSGRVRFATRANFTAPRARERAPAAGRVLSLGAHATIGVNVPTTGTGGATRGAFGSPTAGTMNNATLIGGPNGLGTQTVLAGNIELNPANAVNVGRSPGVFWGAPALAAGRPLGGGGVTTNSASASANATGGSVLAPPAGQGSSSGKGGAGGSGHGGGSGGDGHGGNGHGGDGHDGGPHMPTGF